jgi:serpin B
MRRLAGAEPAGTSTDRHLLERFLEQQDETAFQALVQRHGPMVLGVCRRLLVDPHDADDAFQATFLVLVRKAGSLPWRDSIAPWLFQVARRVALKARAGQARRLAGQREAGNMPMRESGDEPSDQMGRQELRRVLDEELDALPAKYRAPLVLCYLQGKTHEEAAQELGWKRGSIAYRLQYAQDLLRDRLLSRGVPLSAGVAVLLAAERSAAAGLPPALVDATVRLASLVAAGEALGTGAISIHISNLAEGVIQSMFLRKVKTAAVVALVLGVLGGGLGIFWPASRAADQEKNVRILVPADPAQVKADKPLIVKGNTEFAFDLYGRLRSQNGNLFLSPYSISTALAMTSTGARNQTLLQMENTLRFPVEQKRLHPAFGSLIDDTRSGKGYQLHVANALWCQMNYPFTNEFLDVNQTCYGGRPSGVDFAGNTEQARQTINAWVEKQTQDKIKELIKQGILDNLTRLVLTNAIYFKGNWETQFDKKYTQDQPFLGMDGKKNVPLMQRTGKLKYADGGAFQVLELPYSGKELSLVAFLPKQVEGLAAFEKTLNQENLARWLEQMQEREVVVYLPRFKMTSQFLLNEQLKTLGMSDAFVSGRADFSGISPVALKEGLHLSHVIHKGFVDVNEEGTEAAAATAVVLAFKGRPTVFRADHPFFFVIRDNRSGSLLFMGRLVNPE